MIEDLELTEVEGGTRLRLRVRPGARKNAIVGPHGGALKISVTAAPERGKANEAVVELLASALAISRASVAIVSGQTCANKVVVVALKPEVVAERLSAGTPR